MARVRGPAQALRSSYRGDGRVTQALKMDLILWFTERGSQTRKSRAPLPARTLTVTITPRDPPEAPRSPCHRSVAFLPIQSPKVNFLRGCLLEGASREQFILKSGHIPDSDFAWSFHNNPAVFLTCFFFSFFFPPFKTRYCILLLEVLLATVARESWVQLQTHGCLL